jgi:hypothetical protein
MSILKFRTARVVFGLNPPRKGSGPMRIGTHVFTEAQYRKYYQQELRKFKMHNKARTANVGSRWGDYTSKNKMKRRRK